MRNIELPEDRNERIAKLNELLAADMKASLTEWATERLKIMLQEPRFTIFHKKVENMPKIAFVQLECGEDYNDEDYYTSVLSVRVFDEDMNEIDQDEYSHLEGRWEVTLGEEILDEIRDVFEDVAGSLEQYCNGVVYDVG